MGFKVLRLLALLGLLSITAHANGECQLQLYGKLPVTMRGMRPLVKGTINGKPALLSVDSGSFDSTLTRDAARKFGIRLRALPSGTFIGGDNGNITVRGGRVEDFTLVGLAGGRVFHRIGFLVGWYNPGDGSDGSIGQNILGHADTEYDLADGVVRLFLDTGCGQRNLAYWAGSKPVVSMPIRRPSGLDDEVIGSALLNGKKIRVLFDTGTPYSTLTLKAARRIGFSIKNKNVVDGGFAGGLAQRQLEVWIAHFDSLDLNGEIIKNARLRVSNMKPFGADLLLGADFFLSHRVLVSRSHHRVYFTYNGGPVFNFQRRDVKAEMARSAAKDKSPGAQAKSATPSVASLKRQALALADRHEYAKALADFNALIERVPHDADDYMQRGETHLHNGQPALALNDLDQALKIKPKLIEARLIRGSIYLQQRKPKEARTDFEAAIRASAKHSPVELEIANDYLDANMFEQAIAHFTAWIHANPGAERLPLALTERCESRALLDEGLKLALNDCKSALHEERANSYMLSNLALVYLRLGKYDEAVRYYKKSIDLQPKDAWVLYGLWLAEESKGSKTDSIKWKKSALALNPRVAKQYRLFGLGP